MPAIRQILKQTVYSVLDAARIPVLLRALRRRAVVILTYHSFSERGQNGLLPKMDVAEFERQLAYLKKAFEILTLSTAFSAIERGGQRRKPILCLTVDDGFEDAYSILYPVLLKHSIPATIFLSTDFVDHGRAPWTVQLREWIDRTAVTQIDYPVVAPLRTWEEKGSAAHKIKALWLSHLPERRFQELARLKKELKVEGESALRPLTWEQARSMRPSVQFGSHAVYHSHLTRSNPADLDMELAGSKARIEGMLGEECSLFAYPDGDWNPRVSECVRAHGYRMALTQDRGVNTPGSNPHTLKRIHIPENESITVFKCRSSSAVF